MTFIGGEFQAVVVVGDLCFEFRDRAIKVLPVSPNRHSQVIAPDAFLILYMGNVDGREQTTKVGNHVCCVIVQPLQGVGLRPPDQDTWRCSRNLEAFSPNVGHQIIVNVWHIQVTAHAVEWRRQDFITRYPNPFRRSVGQAMLQHNFLVACRSFSI